MPSKYKKIKFLEDWMSNVVATTSCSMPVDTNISYKPALSIFRVKEHSFKPRILFTAIRNIKYQITKEICLENIRKLRVAIDLYGGCSLKMVVFLYKISL